MKLMKNFIEDVKYHLREIQKSLLLFFSNTVPERFWKYIIFVKQPLLIFWIIVGFFVFASELEGEAPILYMILYIVIVILALLMTDIVEKLIRVIEDLRRIATKTEKERLLPLFEDVYNVAREKDLFMSRNVKLFIVDTISINAFAIGRNTIAITRGLMEQMDDDEIKGLIAHEFGHLSSGDTQVQLFLFATNIYLWVLIIFKVIFNLIIKALNLSNKTSFIGDILLFFKSLLEFIINILIFIWTIFVAGRSRKREYRADQFALSLGYKDGILSALYKMYDMQISDKKSLIERAGASHPKLAYRIEKLENAT